MIDFGERPTGRSLAEDPSPYSCFLLYLCCSEYFCVPVLSAGLTAQNQHRFKTFTMASVAATSTVTVLLSVVCMLLLHFQNRVNFILLHNFSVLNGKPLV